MTAVNYMPLSDVGVFILLMIIGIGVFVMIMEATTKRKTQNYRKYLADLWVAAKIKFLAKEDSLDLVAEAEAFKEWSKKSRVRNSEYDLDRTVEADLKERVIEPIKKK